MKNIAITASIAAFFVPKQDSVDGILADLNKKVKQLNTLAISRIERETQARADAVKLQEEADGHANEAKRAFSVRDKIKALLE